MEAVKFDERGNPMCSSVADCGMLTAVEGPRRVNAEYVEFRSSLLSGSREWAKLGQQEPFPPPS